MGAQRLWKHGEHSRAGLNVHTPHGRGSCIRGRVSAKGVSLFSAVCEGSKEGVPFQEGGKMKPQSNCERRPLPLVLPEAGPPSPAAARPWELCGSVTSVCGICQESPADVGKC